MEKSGKSLIKRLDNDHVISLDDNNFEKVLRVFYFNKDYGATRELTNSLAGYLFRTGKYSNYLYAYEKALSSLYVHVVEIDETFDSENFGSVEEFFYDSHFEKIFIGDYFEPFSFN